MNTQEVGRLVPHAPPIASLEGTKVYAMLASSHNTGRWLSTSMGEISAAMMTILRRDVGLPFGTLLLDCFDRLFDTLSQVLGTGVLFDQLEQLLCVFVTGELLGDLADEQS